jgi:hypothetical protein
MISERASRLKHEKLDLLILIHWVTDLSQRFPKGRVSALKKLLILPRRSVVSHKHRSFFGELPYGVHLTIVKRHRVIVFDLISGLNLSPSSTLSPLESTVTCSLLLLQQFVFMASDD